MVRVMYLVDKNHHLGVMGAVGILGLYPRVIVKHHAQVILWISLEILR
jgi:hypothetical protein